MADPEAIKITPTQPALANHDQTPYYEQALNSSLYPTFIYTPDGIPQYVASNPPPNYISTQLPILPIAPPLETMPQLTENEGPLSVSDLMTPSVPTTTRALYQQLLDQYTSLNLPKPLSPEKVNLSKATATVPETLTTTQELATPLAEATASNNETFIDLEETKTIEQAANAPLVFPSVPKEEPTYSNLSLFASKSKQTEERKDEQQQERKKVATLAM